MVGLVIVSHSRALAEAAGVLARGAGGDAIPVDFAGGAGGSRREGGTDAVDIMEAMMRVDSGDGVVALLDSGRAVAASRLAEQLLGSDVSGVRLCPAPLVEGALAAAAAIAAGADIDAVCAAAENALAGKYREMDEDFAPAPGGGQEPAGDVPPHALRVRFRAAGPEGLDLRPAAAIAAALSPFSVSARIRNYDADGEFLDARSTNRIALAGIRASDAAEIALWGGDAAAALDAVRRLVRDGLGREFNPDDADTADLPAVEDGPAGGVPAPAPVSLAPGVAVGSLYIHREERGQLPPLPVADPEYEISRLEAAIARVRAAIGGREGGDAEITAARLLILDDPGLLDQVRADIRALSRDAASSWQARMLELAAACRGRKSPALRERAADVAGVCNQVIDSLLGKGSQDLESFPDLIVWADEATPDLLARWAPGRLRGVLTRAGAPTSHAAILARAMGIPFIAGYVPPREATTGLAVAMDADRAVVEIAPGRESLRDFGERRDEWIRGEAEARAGSAGPAATADGEAVAVLANVSDAASAAKALENGAEGAGLLRTENMFLGRARPPGELEQAEALAAVFSAMGGRPVTVRTLDVGGGRRFAGLPPGGSAPSVLGVRGVRVYRGNPALFKAQLRAVLRAGSGAGGRVDVMIPMVATAEEVDFCRAMLGECHAELSASGVPHLWPMAMGIMVETPAAALQARALAGKADFFSIGTNDLTQYVMCAERGVAELAALADGRQPAVLEAVSLVARAAEEAGIPVSVCGEMAADPAAVPDLLRLGDRRFSVNAPSIGRVKRAVRAFKR